MKKKMYSLAALTVIMAIVAVPTSFAAASPSSQDSLTSQSITIQATQKYVRYSDVNDKYGNASYVPQTYTYADGVWYGRLTLTSTTFQTDYIMETMRVT